MKIRAIFLLIAGIILLSISSCKKSKDEPSRPAIFKINLSDHFILDPFKAVIFISGPDGSVLADTTCNADGSYTFYPQAGEAVPSQLMVTIVNYELYWHGVKVHINTYTGVLPGSEWTIRGTKPDTVGSIFLTLTNVPSPQGAILYSTSGYSNLTFNPTSRGATLYKSPDNLYIKIHQITGDICKSIPDIIPNGKYTIDMSDAVKATEKLIGLPFIALNYEADIWGYQGQDFSSPLPVMTEMVLSDGNAVNSIHVYTPPTGFAGYHSRLMIQETYTSENTYYYSVDGAIPETFVKTGASVQSMIPGSGMVRIESTGPYEMVTGQWTFDSHAFEFYDWNVFGSDSTHVITLPRISHALSTLFPSLAIDSLSYSFTELTEFKSISTYKEFIGKIFNPANPQSPDRFESSVVRKTIQR